MFHGSWHIHVGAVLSNAGIDEVNVQIKYQARIQAGAHPARAPPPPKMAPITI